MISDLPNEPHSLEESWLWTQQGWGIPDHSDVICHRIHNNTRLDSKLEIVINKIETWAYSAFETEESLALGSKPATEWHAIDYGDPGEGAEEDGGAGPG